MELYNDELTFPGITFLDDPPEKLIPIELTKLELDVLSKFMNGIINYRYYETMMCIDYTDNNSDVIFGIANKLAFKLHEIQD